MNTSRLTHAFLAFALIATPVVAIPFIPLSSTTAAAQSVAISVEFRTALSPYGAWRNVPRWGEVWVPARLDRDWRPYTVGHWVYSDEFGWYWISDDQEAEWGWVAFHYGRWVDVDTVGWVWVPGNVWGPAWVDWRRGDEYVGWSPLPPDDVIVEYRSDPRFWMFVRVAELISPRARFAFAPFAQRQTLLQRTVVVNRTVVLNDRRFAVNPGIAPAIVAAAARQPIRTFDVRPHVVAGTANIQGAIEVRADELRRGGNRPGQSIAQAQASSVRQSANSVQPATTVPAPQALGRTENGRLGDNPPRAAVSAQQPGQRGTSPGTTGAAPPIQRQGPPQREERGQTSSPPGTTGAAPPIQRQGPPQREERGQTSSPPSTTGAAPPIQRQGPPQREERNRGNDSRG